MLMERKISGGRGATRLVRALVLLSAALAMAQSGLVAADSRTQAKRMHDRLAGVPPTATVLDSMAADLAAGRGIDAAYKAMEHRAFYDVTLKNFAMPWTNRDQTVFAPLNDYVATVIGMVRDDVPFNLLLSEDILYVGSGGGVPAFSPSSNDALRGSGEQQCEPEDRADAHDAVGGDRPAAGCDRRRHDLAGRSAGVLRRRHQPGDVPLHDDEPPVPGPRAGAGHDAPARSHTPGREPQPGRRQPPVPEQLHRLPRGHGSDGAGLRVLRLRRGRRAASSTRPARSSRSTSTTTTPSGRVTSTPDDHWDNYWRQGRNALLGWDAALPGSGSGAKSLGQELASSDAFARCQVEKVFRNVCFRAPSDAATAPASTR